MKVTQEHLERVWRGPELAEFLGINHRRLLRWREGLDFPSVRVGKAYQFDLLSVCRWMRRRTYYWSCLPGQVQEDLELMLIEQRDI